MSIPREPEDVKLIVSFFSPDKSLIERVISELEDTLGPIDRKSPLLLFDRTRYYAREMGWPLHRRFVSFKNLIHPEDIVPVKLTTNKVENGHLLDGKRKINIDPGYISLERLVLATGKNYTHRIYLSRGIFADLTLIFHRGRFRPLEWTYRDYSDSQAMEFFDEEREKYKQQVRGVGESESGMDSSQK